MEEKIVLHSQAILWGSKFVNCSKKVDGINPKLEK
jgi:hypothetical protein